MTSKDEMATIELDLTDEQIELLIALKMVAPAEDGVLELTESGNQVILDHIRKLEDRANEKDGTPDA